MNYKSPALIACFVVSLLLGSIHAFSVFVPEWETYPGASRASVSFIYSLALVSLTVAVLFGHILYRMLTPFYVFVLVSCLVGVGLGGAALSSSTVELYIYYGVVFGAANGLGYGYTLQLSARAVPSHRAQAMVLVTAFYAVGATAAPYLFSQLINSGGNNRALLVTAFTLCAVTLLAAYAVKRSGIRYDFEKEDAEYIFSPKERSAIAVLWAAYGCAVFAGLMVLGHAYGIARWLELTEEAAFWAVTSVAAGNMIGGFSAVILTRKTSTRFLLRLIPTLTIIAIIILVAPQTFLQSTPLLFVLLGLFLAGYSYGAIIAIYPVAVTDIFGLASSARAYGQIFTAWGLAGLVGPWFSGWLFDRSGSYFFALLIAGILTIFSIIIATRVSVESDSTKSVRQ
ncbi:MAG: OFA family oxalate/formate antiporter-like MFS transporter [Porticoccaceae bacterium]|jgi:OFA family oxalate/formate antiporter-like MFS transporter